MAIRKMLALVVALGCLVAAFIAGSGSAATAAQGDPAIIGADNGETTGTTFCNVDALCGITPSAGIRGQTNKTAGDGVQGVSSGASGYGLFGTGSGSGGTGVMGVGYSYGVHGAILTNTGGWGVWGEGGDRGVYGVSDNEGVVGFGTNVGVRADSPGIALRVTGKVELSRSGSATIVGTSAAPKSSVVVSGVALSAKSMVMVTVQKNVAGVWVRAAVPNVAGSSVTIYLNKAVTTSVPVAWMVIERP